MDECVAVAVAEAVAVAVTEAVAEADQSIRDQSIHDPLIASIVHYCPLIATIVHYCPLLSTISGTIDHYFPLFPEPLTTNCH